MKFRYKLLKAIDLSGFTFLDPVVRLFCGEDREEQIRRIFKMIVVPVAAFVLFIMMWSFLAPRHTTKSGEVPTPSVVWDAAKGIWKFHEREKEKISAFSTDPVLAKAALGDVSERAKLLDEHLIPEAAERLQGVKDAEAEWRIENGGRKLVELRAMVADLRDAELSRREELKRLATETDSESGRIALKEALRENERLTSVERESIKVLEEQIKAIENRRYPQSYWAQRDLEKLKEERQYLIKLSDILANNRSLKRAELEAELEGLNKSYLEGDVSNSFATARRIVMMEDRVARLETTEFSGAKTFPYQIKRSLLCVFTGFIMASLIAIPVGILCGLNRIFMAAMTPFIAIFKPVSPIVWLPIALIVIGGFIPNPDAFQSSMNQLPLLGAYEINPAFFASAITVALCSLWPTLVNTALGVASIDKDHINVARVLKLGWWERLIKIVIPSALPLIFAGLRISLGVGWMVLIAAELLSSSEGIGKFVWDMFSNGSSDSFAQMFVVVFVVGFIGFLLDRIMIIFQRLVSFDGAPTAL